MNVINAPEGVELAGACQIFRIELLTKSQFTKRTQDMIDVGQAVSSIVSGFYQVIT